MNKDPKIALFGYGAMGKEIHRLAIEQELNITNIFDKNILEGTDGMINGGEKYDFDVAIDFTYPDEVISNVESLAAKGKNIVIGTTGWYGQIDRVKRIAEDNGVGIIYGTNFSPGMQMHFMQHNIVTFQFVHEPGRISYYPEQHLHTG